MLSENRVFENVFIKEDTKTEYLVILNYIRSILINYPNLNNNQKLNYCSEQRYYIKLYLREILKCQ